MLIWNAVIVRNSEPFYGTCQVTDLNYGSIWTFKWRASLVPAAAVTPAPLAYTIIVAVKKLVVGLNKYNTVDHIQLNVNWRLQTHTNPNLTFSLTRSVFCTNNRIALLTQDNTKHTFKALNTCFLYKHMFSVNKGPCINTNKHSCSTRDVRSLHKACQIHVVCSNSRCFNAVNKSEWTKYVLLRICNECLIMVRCIVKFLNSMVHFKHKQGNPNTLNSLGCLWITIAVYELRASKLKYGLTITLMFCRWG